jgi:phosphatidylinositol kinase/protein kinase (PI-3  family)
MAVLEAFVYDPLINWRLMQTEVDVRELEGMKFTQFFPSKICSQPSQMTLVILHAELN